MNKTELAKVLSHIARTRTNVRVGPTPDIGGDHINGVRIPEGTYMVCVWVRDDSHPYYPTYRYHCEA